MNNVNFDGSVGVVLVVALLAGAVMALGTWMGQRGVGLRAAYGVLGAGLAVTLLPMLVVGAFGLGWRELLLVALMNVLSLSVAFLPVYVAVNWLGVMRAQMVEREEAMRAAHSSGTSSGA